MTTHSLTSAFFSAPASAARLLALLSVWLHRARTRRILAQLTATECADIGLSVDAAGAEASKPFWKA